MSKGRLKRYSFDFYLTTFSETVISEIQNLWDSSFFSKNLKFFLDSKNSAKNWKKVSCFWDNCIWIGIVELSLARTGYFSSAANVLTRCPKIWHVNKRNFSHVNWLGLDQWTWKRCCDVDFNSALACLQCHLSNGSLKWGFLDIYQPTFWESVISELQNLWGSSFVVKYWKFILDFRNTAKNPQKVFCLWDNFISMGTVKYSLLRAGYFSSAANVLASSPKIWHVKKWDFFQLNLLCSDQWIW